MKPVVLLIGADKGGVGKTTVTRTVLDYLALKNMPARAFDAEHPRGTLKRFHPVSTDVIDITDVADQMKMLDTLHTSDVKVSVIDIRAGLLSGTLQALTFLSAAGRVDLQRVLVLRTVSNYDREAPGVPVAESLQEMVSGNYSAYMPALEAAEMVGDKVVRDLVEHWAERESTIPHAP